MERASSLSCFGLSFIFLFLEDFSEAGAPLLIVWWSGSMSSEMVLPSSFAIMFSIGDLWLMS